MRDRLKCAIIALGVLGLGVWILVSPREASAIPAFARKYHTACTTCHEAFPRLNGVGEAFRLNGYRFNHAYPVDTQSPYL